MYLGLGVKYLPNVSRIQKLVFKFVSAHSECVYIVNALIINFKI